MTTPISLQELKNASRDAADFGTFVNAPSGHVTPREGATYPTAAQAAADVAGLIYRGAWATANTYVLRDLALQGGVVYVCIVGHTAGTFATDLAAGRWAVYQGVSGNDLSANTGASLVGWFNGTLKTVGAWIDDLLVAVGLRVREYSSYANAAGDTSPDGTTVILRCRTTAGDGGHGLFRVQTSGTLPTANGGTVLARTAGGVLVLLDYPRPEHFGAKANDAASAAANAVALNAYAMWCMSINAEQDYRSGPYYYSATLDLSLSPNRNAVLIGDCNDMNNDGVYSLVYTGAGIAIKGKCVFHRQLGVAGTASVIDTIPAANTAFDVTESFTHVDSSIRNFDKAYVSRGGFYNSVRGGRLTRSRRLYDFTNNPGGVYNFTADAAHDGFVDGVVANSGAGPVRLAGSWEAFTGQIVKNTSGTPRYKVILDNPYIENYPSQVVAAGLTANPLDTYISPYAFLTRDSSVSGRAVIYTNGFTSRIFYAVGGYPVLDIDIDWREAPGCPLLVFAPYIKAMNIRGLYEDSLYASTTVVDGGAQNEMNAANTSGSMGQYLRPDGTIVRHGRTWVALSLLNGWTNGASVKALSYKVLDSILYIVGYMNGSAATNQVVAQLPTALLASIPDAFHWFPVNSPSAATQGRIIKSSGDLRIETTGVNGMAVNVAIPLK